MKRFKFFSWVISIYKETVPSKLPPLFKKSYKERLIRDDVDLILFFCITLLVGILIGFVISYSLPCDEPVAQIIEKAVNCNLTNMSYNPNLNSTPYYIV